MKYKNLGKTDLKVSELCLGTMIFGEKNSRGVDEENSAKLIQKYLDAKGNFLDTADVYANGKSEEIIGKTINEYRDDLIIATKLRFPMGDDINMRGLSRKYIIKAVNASLNRLKTNYIDLLYIHCSTPTMSYNELLKTLHDLVTSNKVFYIGVSNWKAWEVMKALDMSEMNNWARFEAVQYQYSLVERNIEYEFPSLIKEEHLSLFPWGPLGGGFLSGKYKSDQVKPPDGTRIAVMEDHTEEAWHRRATEKNWQILKTMELIKEETEMSYVQIALSWLLNQTCVTSPIIGARTLEQLEDNLGVIDAKLTKEQVKNLNNVSKPNEIYPYRMISNYCS